MVTAMHLLAAALLFVGPPPGDTLAGRVTDSAGAPVPSASGLLSELPRLNALTTGAQIAKPMIRGLAGARVLVLANGNRLEDYSWSDEDGPSVDARLAQRVELIRGPASVLYGSDALGGVVNVIPAELPDANGGPRVIRTGFELSGATNNAELEAAARVEGASGPWAWRVFGIGRAAGSLHTPAGELDNTGFGAVNGEAVIGRRGARYRRRVGAVPDERHARPDPARPRRAREVGCRIRVRAGNARALERARRRPYRRAAAHHRRQRHARARAAAARLHGLVGGR